MYEVIIIAILTAIIIIMAVVNFITYKKKKNAVELACKTISELIEAIKTVKEGVVKFNDIYDVQLSFYRDKDGYVFKFKDPNNPDIEAEYAARPLEEDIPNTPDHA